MKNNLFPLLLVCFLSFCPLAEAGNTYYEYDANGRLVMCTYANQAIVQYSYDAVGNVISIDSFEVGVFVDTDLDGIDDNWELFYFDSLLVVNDSTDYDKDGYTDLEEYLLWNDGTLDDKGFPFNPLFYNFGEKNPPKGNILLMIVPILSADQTAKN